MSIKDRIKNAFKGSSAPAVAEAKSYLAECGIGYSDAPFSFADYLGAGSNGDLRALEACRLYRQCTPFFQSVSMRAEAFSSLPIRVYDKKTKTFLERHPILDLLNKPNPQDSRTSFLKAYSSFYDITGECFFMVTGDKGREPLEIYVAKPQQVTIQASNAPFNLGAAGVYWWQSTYFAEQYYLDTSNELGGSYRYWNREGSREFAQVKDFNPMASVNCLRGLPKAAPLWLQIQQFILADTNNKSVLSRGARPSVAWVSKLDEPLTDEQYQRWKEQVNSYEGAINAGRQVLVDNVEPKIISTTNKDMEFANNRKVVRDDIFSAYGIPLSAISSESMTMDNLKVSGLLFYENAVLPMADNLLDELTRVLMPRYKASEDLCLAYNPIDIPALKARSIGEASELRKVEILTDNELRSRVGYEALPEGGDVVYKPSGVAPYESDAFTGDNLTSPDNAEKGRSLESFRAHCKTIVRPDGSRVFGDTEVELMARDFGLLKD